MTMTVTATRRFVDPQRIRALLPTLAGAVAEPLVAQRSRELPPAKASVAAVFRWREREQRTLELLFIRRSFNERDTWSGQVAFPGGRRQRRGAAPGPGDWESSLETATRETLEEIGLDLTNEHVQWLGSLPTIQTHLRTFWVGTEIFLLKASAEDAAFEPVIQDSEIADVFWVDVQELFNPQRYRPLAWPLEDMVPWLRRHPWAQRLAARCLGDLLFGAIHLPRPHVPHPDDDHGERHRNDFVLWGLTLRMICDMFQLAQCPLPLATVSPRFEAERLGSVFLFCYRYPDRALKRALAVTAACTALGLYSKL